MVDQGPFSGDTVRACVVNGEEEFYCPAPEWWSPAHTAAFAEYLNRHHDTHSEDPAFGFVHNRVIHCQSRSALIDAARYATRKVIPLATVPAPKVTAHRRVTETTTYRLNAADIRRLLGLPDNARVFVQIPGGGSWSNTDLPIDVDCPVIATYTAETSE